MVSYVKLALKIIFETFGKIDFMLSDVEPDVLTTGLGLNDCLRIGWYNVISSVKPYIILKSIPYLKTNTTKHDRTNSNVIFDTTRQSFRPDMTQIFMHRL